MSLWYRFRIGLKNYFFSGLVVTVPLIITIVVLRAIFNFFDRLFLPLVAHYFHIRIPGLGIVLGVVAILMIGGITRNYFGHKLVQLGEWIVSKIPIAKTVYSGVQQMLLTFGGQQKASFKDVVLLEYPRMGVYSLGFLNGILKQEDGGLLLSVLVMTSINPTSGYLVLLPPEAVRFTTLKIEEAMKMIVSAGIVLPETLQFKPNPYSGSSKAQSTK